ncbi:MAG: class II glutamine amidotransferase [Gammaproteobacteria bacterium]
MCELLGMSANVPTDIRFSFTGLMQRGGHTGPHRDGWGIGFYEGRACRLFHDPQASADSQVARLIKSYSIKSRIVVSHIRRANRGRVCLENTHPFSRELWGCSWAFVHNGQLKGVKKLPLSFYKPIGTTDSEHAFCWMLDRIRGRYRNAPRRLETLWRFIYDLACELRKRGSFNFLLSDSKFLYGHCSTHLCWITRRAPFGRARLIDVEVVVDFEKETTPKDIVTVIASRPLTHDEEWTIMKRGAFNVFTNGVPVGNHGAYVD